MHKKKIYKLTESESGYHCTATKKGILLWTDHNGLHTIFIRTGASSSAFEYRLLDTKTNDNDK